MAESESDKLVGVAAAAGGASANGPSGWVDGRLLINVPAKKDPKRTDVPAKLATVRKAHRTTDMSMRLLA